MMTIILITNTLFLLSNHPMSMGLILIIQTILFSMLSGMMMKTFWMSYLIAITMLSGMLILFMYMSSIASNEKFSNMTPWKTTIIIVMASTMPLFLAKKMIIKNNYFSMGGSFLKGEKMLFLSKLFMWENMAMTILMVSYLFMTMIVATHLVNSHEGPMRMKH